MPWHQRDRAPDGKSVSQVQLPENHQGQPTQEFDEPERRVCLLCFEQVQEVQERMKKSKLLFLLLPFMAAASYAQESRQDVSLSASELIAPRTFGQGITQTQTLGLGGLISYRYMLTPRSAVEGNFQYGQNRQHYITNFQPTVGVHTRFEEYSAAYVYYFTYKKFNPFVEGGIGGFMYSPIDDEGTTTLSVKKATNIGFLYGGGIAYELSPSFDLRIEYRALVEKTPTLPTTANPTFNTGQYYNVNNPVIGVAYHF
jgi:opacity protein-like surface antigen